MIRKIGLGMLAVLWLLGWSCSPSFREFKTIENSPREWKMFRNSLDGYYQKDVYGSQLRKLKWKADLKASSYSSPVATASYVAVSALDGYLYFFDLQSGERINVYKFDAPLSESPLISNKIIYTAGGPRKNFVAGLNLITGKYIFKEPMQDVNAPIVADDKYILVGDYSGRFVCLDKFAGKLQWEYQTGGAILGAPALRDGRVFIGSLDKNLYALEAKKGTILWSYQAGSAINTAPAVDSLVYFASFDGRIRALRAVDGTAVWEFATGGHVLSSPVIDDQRLYIGSNDRQFYCLDKFNGQKIWSYDTDGIIDGTPLVLEDVAVIASGGGTLYMFDKLNGELLFSFETDQQIKSSPIFFEGLIFITSLDKHLYCFSN